MEREEISAGTDLDGLVAQVSAPGLIRGKVSYEDGEPAWAQVTLLPANGDTDRIAGEAVTNSHGEYEIAGAKPGKYYVVAVPTAESRFVARVRLPGQDDPAQTPMGYAHSFYPGVSSIRSAALVAVADDSEAEGIDIPLRPAPLVSLHGRVMNSVTGQPLAGALSLTAVGVTGFMTGPPAELSAAAGPDGSFIFRGVPAGTYLFRGSGHGEEWSIEEDIEVAPVPEQHTIVYYQPCPWPVRSGSEGSPATSSALRIFAGTALCPELRRRGTDS